MNKMEVKSKKKKLIFMYLHFTGHFAYNNGKQFKNKVLL